MNRPDPKTLAAWCYYMAFASSGIMTLALILGLVPGAAALTQVIWLALITSAIGVFLGFAARSDFKGKDIDPTLNRKLKVGLRTNVIALVVMFLFVVVFVVFRIINA